MQNTYTSIHNLVIKKLGTFHVFLRSLLHSTLYLWMQPWQLPNRRHGHYSIKFLQHCRHQHLRFSDILHCYGIFIGLKRISFLCSHLSPQARFFNLSETHVTERADPQGSHIPRYQLLSCAYAYTMILCINAVVVGDFSIHNSSWLRHSSHAITEGQYVELFAPKTTWLK